MAKDKAAEHVKPKGNPNIAEEGKTHQWPPGQSGNPNGAPKAKTNLYRYLCEYLQMTTDELASVEEGSLSLSRLAALKSARKMDWKRQQEVINRDEGKVPDRIAGPEGEALKFYSGIEQDKV